MHVAATLSPTSRRGPPATLADTVGGRGATPWVGVVVSTGIALPQPGSPVKRRVLGMPVFASAVVPIGDSRRDRVRPRRGCRTGASVTVVLEDQLLNAIGHLPEPGSPRTPCTPRCPRCHRATLRAPAMGGTTQPMFFRTPPPRPTTRVRTCFPAGRGGPATGSRVGTRQTTPVPPTPRSHHGPPGAIPGRWCSTQGGAVNRCGDVAPGPCRPVTRNADISSHRPVPTPLRTIQR
jgi:hypothetical protein